MMENLFRTLEARRFNVHGTSYLRTFIGAVLLHRAISEFRYACFLYSSQGTSSGTSEAILGPWLGMVMDKLFYLYAP